MATRLYQSNNINIERMIQDLEGAFLAQNYQTQHFTTGTQRIVQLREGGNFEALFGMQATLTVILQPTHNGILATVGEQQWIDKAAVGLLGAVVLWPLLITAGVGIIRQSNLEYQILSKLDMVARQQNPDVQIITNFSSPSQPPPNQEPYTSQSQAPNQGPQPSQAHAPNDPPQAGPIPMPGYGQKQCPRCQAINDADDSFCSYCGTSLTMQKKLCANCNAELKAGAAFCVKCGTPVPH